MSDAYACVKSYRSFIAECWVGGPGESHKDLKTTNLSSLTWHGLQDRSEVKLVTPLCQRHCSTSIISTRLHADGSATSKGWSVNALFFLMSGSFNVRVRFISTFNLQVTIGSLIIFNFWSFVCVWFETSDDSSVWQNSGTCENTL